MTDLVSIITPNYNGEKFIKRCIYSVLNQTYVNWELIIIDDGSTDESLNIIKEFESNYGNVSCICLNGNNGAAVARNKGIEAAKGNYIAFLDNDDAWLPKKLERQLQFMKSNEYDLSFSSYYSVDENFENQYLVDAKSEISYSRLLTTNYLGCLTVMYNAGRIGKHYFPLIRKRQDWALWLKLLRILDIKAYGIKEPLAIYTRRKQSVSSSKLDLIKYNWKVYQLENISFVKSVILLKLLILKRLLRFPFRFF
ncbi:MAG: hypothetical protein BM564_09955 [Bacteroidetes bacterium MedPE-SWsnd-G2]|nr:MAG: hypothetical protein BM564_09955 [Bacteroidetes bacterium MedPE-SWsnd-G2]